MSGSLMSVPRATSAALPSAEMTQETVLQKVQFLFKRSIAVQKQCAVAWVIMVAVKAAELLIAQTGMTLGSPPDSWA